jgi:predicted nucleotide-binding protein
MYCLLYTGAEVEGMARRQQVSKETPGVAELLISVDDAKVRLGERVEKGRALRNLNIQSTDDLEKAQKEYYSWSEYNTELLKRIFTTNQYATEYSFWAAAAFSLGEQSVAQKLRKYYEEVDSKVRRLQSIIERLELIPSSANLAQPAQDVGCYDKKIVTNRVFIVHGHDEVSKSELEIFLREVGLEPIVLHRQADQGRTIIEKFEQHSDVSYAFILLTPDEVAHLKSDENKPDSERKVENRARQNVIFEFGYFVGKLGRSKVCCLYTGDVTLPSDVSGVIYKRFINKISEVAYEIIKELKASGYHIL